MSLRTRLEYFEKLSQKSDEPVASKNNDSNKMEVEETKEEQEKCGSSEHFHNVSVAPAGSPYILSDHSRNIEDYYSIGPVFGQPGAYGSARVVVNLETREEFCLKTISKARRNADEIEMFRGELNVLLQLKRSDNVIHFHDAFESPSHLHIVMELCRGGELFDRISSHTQICEEDTRVVLKQILLGIKSLHDQNIAHCDIKPSNVVFTSTGPEGRACLIDFGMAKLWNPAERELFTAGAGTCYYAAPEVIERRYNLAADLWSLGVVAFVMLEGFPPFFGNSNAIIRGKVLDGFLPEVKSGPGAWFPVERPISEGARDFISKLLVTDVATRLTVDEALRHPWLSQPASNEPLSPMVLESLRGFNARCLLQLHVLHIMADILLSEEQNDLEAVFTAMDQDGDGLVSLDEFRAAVKQSPHSASLLDQCEEVFERADLDMDGKLCFSELMSTAVELKLVAKEERLRKAFSRLDLDASGKISFDELKQILNTNDAHSAKLIEQVDQDADFMVNYEEFLSMWRTENSKF